MPQLQKKTYRYSDCFKRKVVEEVSRGSSISQVSRRYGIKGGSTVRSWLKRYGREDLLNEIIYVKMRTESDRIKELEEENRSLKLALADATLACNALEGLVEVANKHYGVDLKKNFATRPSARSVKKQGKV